jgi:hypothetical protein
MRWYVRALVHHVDSSASDPEPFSIRQTPIRDGRLESVSAYLRAMLFGNEEVSDCAHVCAWVCARGTHAQVKAENIASTASNHFDNSMIARGALNEFYEIKNYYCNGFNFNVSDPGATSRVRAGSLQLERGPRPSTRNRLHLGSRSRC